jgi:phosphopantothenoylcysteine decarboxylase/phosphopantothenate--cysteine ligase
VLNADTGALASGLVGQGRLPEPEVIFEEVRKMICKKPWWGGKRILITAGPTHEALDPVRYIGNLSSGKMGYALAHEAAARGAEVILVSGPSAEMVFSRAIRRVDVQSAQQMADACKAEHDSTDIWVFCAAVADYRPEEVSTTKVKKSGGDWNIQLIENVDIAAAMGSLKKHQLSIGFALESGDGQEAALSKLTRKNLDLICLNSLDQAEGTPLGAETNAYRLLTHQGREISLAHAPKTALAAQILDVVETL